MIYESVKTSKGNIGVSYASQEAADAQAAAMDASNCSNCRYCRYCSNCSNCINCRYCINCSNCSNCSYCGGVLRWAGGTATILLALNGLVWPIAISNKQMQIGCQIHSPAAWREFDEVSIAAMGERALPFWLEHRSRLLALCEMKSLALDK